jgi:hypothetical protein
MTRQEIETRFSATLDALERINKTIALHESLAPIEHTLIIQGWKNKRKKVTDNFLNDLKAFELELLLDCKVQQQTLRQAA